MECSEGQACNWQTGVCEPTCSEDADCPEEEFCSAITQFCTPEFRCETDADCTTGSCVGGVCVGCTDDTDCQQGLTCTFGLACPTLLVLTHVQRPIVMKQPRLVTHWMAVAIQLMALALRMMNAVKYMIAVSLGFVRAARWTVIVDLTNVVFSLPVCCSDENETLSYV